MYFTWVSGVCVKFLERIRKKKLKPGRGERGGKEGHRELTEGLEGPVHSQAGSSQGPFQAWEAL